MTKFIDHEAMVKCAEAAVREEARRYPHAPWAMQPGDTHEFVDAVAAARKRLRNELVAGIIDRVAKAANARDIDLAMGQEVRTWARNTLAWAAEPEKITALYEFDDDKNVDLDEAIAALSRAIN